MSHLLRLRQRHAAPGVVTWIGVRPARLEPIMSFAETELGLDGLSGDHARSGPRALTLIQAEHLPVIAALSGHEEVHPETLRRNILIKGINLMALRHDQLRLGQAVIRLTKPCSPCSRMEKALGPGGYNAMRGHGGWYAEVVAEGRVALGDCLSPIFD